MGQPSFYHTTVALSFQIESLVQICAYGQNLVSFLQVYIFKKYPLDSHKIRLSYNDIIYKYK